MKPLPTPQRLIDLLAHAVDLADGWFDESRGGKIKGDGLIDAAREIIAENGMVLKSRNDGDQIDGGV